MSQEMSVDQMRDELGSFLERFRQYTEAVYGNKQNNELEVFASSLRIAEPKITDMILKIIGNGQVTTGGLGMPVRVVRYSDLLSNALIGGAMRYNARAFHAAVTQALEKAIGTLDAGLWPPKTPAPVLIIRDVDLQQRCADLLSAPGNYDRVILVATTVLEDRMRRKPPHETLARLILNSGDQTGENLANKLFAPNDPVLSISNDKTKRIAFHRMLLGVFSYLRNPYHHSLDDQTQWSWAWSAVGLVDRLLADVDSCIVA